MIKQDAIRGSSLAAVVGAAILSSSAAFAGPALSSHEMQTALVKAREGPTELRRYVERTKPIYELDYNEVMAVAEQQKAMALADQQKATASNPPVEVARAARH
jgi:hypothetical protein